MNRVVRHTDAQDLSRHAARMLLDTLVELQATQEVVHLCLCAGEVATQTYEVFADLVPDSQLDPSRLHLWWGDEAYAPTTDPARTAPRLLTILARTLHVASSQIHVMPSSEGHADPSEAAFAYAAELGDTVFDLCLLGMGVDGHVGSIFPGHASMDSASLAMGVSDAPKPPAERIGLTLNAINRSHRVWLWVAGEQKAPAVTQALDGDETLPAALVHGTQQTLWFLDEAAARDLPRYHCVF